MACGWRDAMSDNEATLSQRGAGVNENAQDFVYAQNNPRV
jgi:hypothetical protein